MTYGRQIGRTFRGVVRLSDHPNQQFRDCLITCLQSAETHNFRSQPVAICKGGGLLKQFTAFRMRAENPRDTVQFGHHRGFGHRPVARGGTNRTVEPNPESCQRSVEAGKRAAGFVAELAGHGCRFCDGNGDMTTQEINHCTWTSCPRLHQA